MILNQYDILTKAGQHVTVFATGHEVQGEEVTLFSTHQGMHFDVFPSDYWEKFLVNGVDLVQEEVK